MFCLSLIGLHGGWGKSVVRETFSFEEIGQVDVARVTGFRKEMRAFGHNAPPNGAAVVVAAAAVPSPSPHSSTGSTLAEFFHIRSRILVRNRGFRME